MALAVVVVIAMGAVVTAAIGAVVTGIGVVVTGIGVVVAVTVLETVTGTPVGS